MILPLAATKNLLICILKVQSNTVYLYDSNGNYMNKKWDFDKYIENKSKILDEN